MVDISELEYDKKLLNILNKYSKENLGDLFLKIIENSKSNEIIIPVLGLQGMGKSTLINSILSENILPNDADETTCVPVEVKYGEEEKALVYFKSKKVVEAFTREDLNEYVDNMFNPGNEKQVSHIVLYRKINLLKSGAVIVDLPGVGSLTKENQETTMRYIKNLCTAIFLIPTTPTIRKSEELFIKSVWMQFSSAIFVQNNFGESKREVLESVEFNSKVLKNIAKSINNNFNDEIIVVNAYDALYGELHNNKKLTDNSNIKSLINKIDRMLQNWNEDKKNNIKNRSISIINASKEQIERYIEEYSLSKEELNKKYQAEEENFKYSIKKLKEQVEEIEDFLNNKEIEVRKFAHDQAKNCTEDIRSATFILIDDGLVDGVMLTEAFNNIQQQYIEDVINNYFDFQNEIVTNLNDKFQKLLEIESNLSISSLNFNNGQSFKFEKGINFGINIIGAFGALKLGTAIGGTIGGLLGVIVGGVAGVVVGILGSILGNKTKKSITDVRGRKTKDQIDEFIQSISFNIKHEIIQNFEDSMEQINEFLYKYIENKKKIFKEIKADNMTKIKNNFKSNFNLEELKNDYDYLTIRERNINE